MSSQMRQRNSSQNTPSELENTINNTKKDEFQRVLTEREQRSLLTHIERELIEHTDAQEKHTITVDEVVQDYTSKGHDEQAIRSSINKWIQQNNTPSTYRGKSANEIIQTKADELTRTLKTDLYDIIDRDFEAVQHVEINNHKIRYETTVQRQDDDTRRFNIKVKYMEAKNEPLLFKLQMEETIDIPEKPQSKLYGDKRFKWDHKVIDTAQLYGGATFMAVGEPAIAGLAIGFYLGGQIRGLLTYEKLKRVHPHPEPSLTSKDAARAKLHDHFVLPGKWIKYGATKFVASMQKPEFSVRIRTNDEQDNTYQSLESFLDKQQTQYNSNSQEGKLIKEAFGNMIKVIDKDYRQSVEHTENFSL